MGPLQIAATALSAIGAVSSAGAQNRAANYNAAVADRNAQVTRQQTEAELQRLDRAQRQRLGTQRTMIAKSGVMLEGSPLDVLEQSAAEGEMDKLTLQYKGELQAMGFEDTASLNRSQAASAPATALYGVGKSILIGSTAGTNMFSDEEDRKAVKLKRAGS